MYIAASPKAFKQEDEVGGAELQRRLLVFATRSLKTLKSQKTQGCGEMAKVPKVVVCPVEISSSSSSPSLLPAPSLQRNRESPGPEKTGTKAPP